jgi:hypothetical protein
VDHAPLVLERIDVRQRRPGAEHQGDDREDERQRESGHYDSLFPKILQRRRVYPISA